MRDKPGRNQKTQSQHSSSFPSCGPNSMQQNHSRIVQACHRVDLCYETLTFDDSAGQSQRLVKIRECCDDSQAKVWLVTCCLQKSPWEELFPFPLFPFRSIRSFSSKKCISDTSTSFFSDDHSAAVLRSTILGPLITIYYPAKVWSLPVFAASCDFSNKSLIRSPTMKLH